MPVLTILLLMFAACDNVAPTLTPTRPISAPTLEASPEIFPFIPTNLPFEEEIAIGNDPTAAAFPRDAELPPLALDPTLAQQEIIIVGADGTLITGWLYVNPIGERAPGVLLLGAQIDSLRNLAGRLRDSGFSALALSLSVEADFDAALMAFSGVSLVDPGRLAVIGVGESAPLALMGCAATNLCDGAALLSPADNAAMFARLPVYGMRALFLAAGTNEAAHTVIEQLREAVRGQVTFAGVPSNASGVALLAEDADLFPLLVAWLNAQFA